MIPLREPAKQARAGASSARGVPAASAARAAEIDVREDLPRGIQPNPLEPSGMEREPLPAGDLPGSTGGGQRQP